MTPCWIRSCPIEPRTVGQRAYQTATVLTGPARPKYLNSQSHRLPDSPAIFWLEIHRAIDILRCRLGNPPLRLRRRRRSSVTSCRGRDHELHFVFAHQPEKTINFSGDQPSGGTRIASTAAAAAGTRRPSSEESP